MQSKNINVLSAVSLMTLGEQRAHEAVWSEPRTFVHVCKERGVSKNLYLEISEWRLLMALSLTVDT